MHPFLLTLIHLAIATGGLLVGSFLTAIVASQSSMRGAGYALWMFLAVGSIGLISLAVSLFQRAAHVGMGQRVLWVVLYGVGAAGLALGFGVLTLIATNR